MIILLDTRAATTALKQPKELTTFARDSDGDFVYDRELADQLHLNYYYLPATSVARGLNLASGFKHFRQIDEARQVKGDFPALCTALQHHEEATGKRTAGKIVSFRGTMTKLLTLPYDPKALDMYIIPFDGQLFLVNNGDAELARRQPVAAVQQLLPLLVPSRRPAPSGDPELQEKLQFSGYKFETLATLRQPWSRVPRVVIELRHKEQVLNYEQYLAVVSSGVGKVRTVLCGEVDCVWDYKPARAEWGSDDPLTHYVELKTSGVVSSPPQAARFELKLFRTWAQCFLLGIRKVVYGFRDQGLVLRQVEEYSADEIPVLLQEGSGRYKCMEALRWYGGVLDKLAALEHDAVWHLHAREGEEIHVERMGEAEGEAVRLEHLPAGFVQWRRLLPPK